MTNVNLSLSEVARGVGISPQNLHKTYIKKGKISITRDELGRPSIALVEVLRVFGSQFQSEKTAPQVQAVEDKPVEEKEAKVKAVDSLNQTVLNPNPELLAKISALESQLREEKDRRHSAEKDKEWLMGQVEKLSDTIKLIGYTQAPETPASTKKTSFWKTKIF